MSAASGVRHGSPQYLATLPNAMKGCISAPDPALPFGYSPLDVRRLSALFHRLSFDCVWEVATTHVGLVVLGFVVFLMTRYVRSPWRSVPPGPWGFPIIGNAAKLQDKTWLFGPDCKKKYSAFSASTDSVLALTIVSKRTWCT
jgi:hypothetical protein